MQKAAFEQFERYFGKQPALDRTEFEQPESGQPVFDRQESYSALHRSALMQCCFESLGLLFEPELRRAACRMKDRFL